MNFYYGWHTSINIQNASGSAATITIYYFNPNGTLARTPRTDTIPAFASRSYYSPSEGLPSPNFIGSAKITSNRNVVVATNQSTYITNIYRGSSYNGTFSGSAYLVVPNLLNHWGAEDWVSRVNVRNLGTLATNVYISFDNATPSPWYINVNGSKSVYIPDYWGTNGIIGPALVWTDNWQPISVVVNQSSATLTTDYTHSYNGFNR